MICRPACCLLFSIIVLWVAPAVSAELRKVPPLPRGHGTEVIVDDVGRLKQVIENARDNTTILIADGTYRLGNLIYLRAKRNVTLRGASGDPTKVILSGVGWDSENQGDDILRIGDCENVTSPTSPSSTAAGTGSRWKRKIIPGTSTSTTAISAISAHAPSKDPAAAGALLAAPYATVISRIRRYLRRTGCLAETTSAPST